MKHRRYSAIYFSQETNTRIPHLNKETDIVTASKLFSLVYRIFQKPTFNFANLMVHTPNPQSPKKNHSACTSPGESGKSNVRTVYISWRERKIERVHLLERAEIVLLQLHHTFRNPCFLQPISSTYSLNHDHTFLTLAPS